MSHRLVLKHQNLKTKEDVKKGELGKDRKKKITEIASTELTFTSILLIAKKTPFWLSRKMDIKLETETLTENCICRG